MRIKSLSLRGFKSFMDKSSFQIPPGISAFVGPNGCGKSNVVDAIRWVMGEQSPKQLRGRQMEDMIFSGAGPLKPLGMAEVTLTLEDTEEFYGTSEISVTRRLYRSNESEYLISNSPCRLKDIQDLFMGTGLGNRSYSVIAQGEIGSIIEQKPEETRRLLEEAAGITKYKSRREAALRKISLTKENLSRVQDLVEEIRRGMNSLKRQAHKARRFKEASSEIHRLELVLNAHTYDELNGERRKRKEIIDDLVDKASEAEARFSECEEIIEATNMELIERERNLSALKESVFSLREEYSKNEDAVLHLSADQERLRTTDTKLNREKEEIGQRILEFQSEIKDINSRVEELQKLIQEVSRLRSHYDSVFKDERLTLDRMKDELKGGKPRLTELTTEEARLKGEIGNLSETINQLESRKDGLEGESREIAKKLETLSLLLNEKKGKRKEMLIRAGSVDKDLQEVRTRQEGLEALRKRRESDRAAAESELTLALSQLKAITSLIENYEGYQSGVQSIMNSLELKTGRQGKILGVVADFIQVEPEFELAVEAVLAERLQYVIVARQEDGREAVEYLRSKERGRSYFLPLEEFKSEDPGGKFEVNLNGFKLLREHVSAPERFTPVIKSFLGDAALVDNLSQALSAWRRDRGQQTLVTPEGDLVDRRGVIIGGRLGKESLGLLKRRRRKTELENEIKEKEELIVSVQKELGELAVKLHDLGALAAQLEGDNTARLQQIDLMDKDIFLLEKESEQLMKHSGYVLNQLESLDTDKGRRVSHLNNLRERLSGCLEDKEKIEQGTTEKEAEVERLERALEDSKERLSQLSVTYNQYTEEEKGLAREKERLAQFTGEMGMRIKAIQEEITVTGDHYNSSVLREKHIRERLTAIGQKQREVEEEGSGLEQGCHILKDRLREQEKKSVLIREEMDALRNQINDAKIREAEVDFQLNGILSQVSKETGINLQRDYREYLVEDFSKEHYESKLKGYRLTKERIGEVNLLAITEYEKLKERYDFITSQQQDLLASIASVNNAIRRINRISKRRFLTTLGQVDEQLKKVFPILFNGGSARLRLTDESLPLESGVLVEVQPPGKRLVHMGLLSGGEKALAAMALLFAIYLIRPSPFIVMDEVDAPLDEANTDRFNDLLQEIRKSSQIIMVTHNRRTMEIAERLYGLVMNKTSVSKIVSVDLRDYQPDSKDG